MFRSFVSATQFRHHHQHQQQSEAAAAAGGDSLESQFSCPICLEVYHKPVSIASCAHTWVARPAGVGEADTSLLFFQRSQSFRRAVCAGSITTEAKDCPGVTLPSSVYKDIKGSRRIDTHYKDFSVLGNTAPSPPMRAGNRTAGQSGMFPYCIPLCA